MAKTEKVKNRKLRRRVRRTSAIVLLITSIIVAAIPVPENAAAPTGGISTHDLEDARYEYDYKVNEEFNAAVTGIKSQNPRLTREDEIAAIKALTMPKPDDISTNAINLKGPTNGNTIRKCPYIFKIGNEYIYQQDQFSIYDSNSSSIICDFAENYTLRNQRIKIPNFMSGKYEIVTGDMLTQFKNERRNNLIITLDSPSTISGITNAGTAINDIPLLVNNGSGTLVEDSSSVSTRDIIALIEKYAGNDYTSYKTRYDNYDFSGGTPWSETFEFKANDYINDSRCLEYYCDITKSSVCSSNYRMAGCVLQPVVETDNENAEQYVPQVAIDTSEMTSTDAGLLTVDGNAEDVENGNNKGGFVCGDRSGTIRGIADYAFYQINNISTLVLPENLQYIGDSAFEDSFITSLEGVGLRYIGNRAFKHSRLESYKFQDENLATIQELGAEAFSETNLTSFEIPNSLTRLGAGAFAKCRSLASLAAESQEMQCEIGNYAFYDCTALSEIDWKGSGSGVRIGDGAFALSEGNGSLQKFTFPALSPDSNSGTPAGNATRYLGNYILAGQDNLKEVYMPHSTWASGNRSVFTLPQYTFVDCKSLEFVDFTGDDKGNTDYGRAVNFDPYLFYEVENEDFYVRGPQWYNSAANEFAEPRKSTWSATTILGRSVPYVYYNRAEDTDYYEIDDKSYVYAINTKTGMLVSCIQSPNFDGSDPSKKRIVEIPDKVGNTVVTGISTDCFNQDPQVKENMEGLRIKSGSRIETIADSAFANCPKLVLIDLGDSIRTVGNNAFYNCGSGNTTREVDVYFRSPESAGDKSAYYAAFKMGDGAFTTNGNPVIFHGDIVKEFAPFTYAMTTPVNETAGLGVCYKSLAPENLTVIADRTNGEMVPTLVDYPHYEEVDKDNPEFLEEAEQFWESRFREDRYDKYRDAYNKALADGEDATVYDGPWNYRTEADPGYFGRHPYSLLKVYNNVMNKDDDGSEVPTTPDAPGIDPGTATEAQNLLYEMNNTMLGKGEAIMQATMDVVVPAGVESIDANQFYTNSANSANRLAYFNGGRPSRTEKYTNDGDGTESVVPGLFSGWFDEGSESAQTPGNKRGNDYIRSITLTDVKKLPDYAFDNCENLESVILGEAMEDIGTAPFRECPKLIDVEGNEKFIGNNGIVYSVNTDGNYIIEVCLSSRGELIGGRQIDSTNDPLLTQVGYIRPGAFEGCNYISSVNLTDAEKLEMIPEDCFKDCARLRTVYLPQVVNSIQNGAFGNVVPCSVTIPGREVDIATDAFEHTDEITIRTYKDSAAARYATYHELTLETLGETHKVTFMDYDGVILKEEYVEDGKDATPPEENPTRENYTFTGWQGSYQQVYDDRTIIAQYTPNGWDPNNPNNGNNGGNSGGNNGNNGSNNNNNRDDDDDDDDDDDEDEIHTVTVVNGMGSGRYKKGRTVTITANPAPEGQTFSYWTTESENVALANANNSTTTFTMPDNRVTVTANYKEGSSGSSTTYSTTAPTVDTNTGDGSGTGTGGGDGSGSSGGTGGGDGTVTVTDTAQDTNTTVIVTKPGISNTDLASATVEGSNDNFVVKVTASDVAEQEVQNALLNEFGSLDNIVYTAMDISLYDATGTIQLADTSGLRVNITLPIPDGQISYGGNNKAAGVVNGTLDKLDARYNMIDGVDCITFTATHFSPYTIYVDTANLTAATDMSPQTGDPIHPKWFLAIGLACLSVLLFIKRDEKPKAKAVV